MPPKLWVPSSVTNRSSTPLKHMTDQVRRAEALSLYREILRSAKHFHWVDKIGQPWNKALKDQARKEFEDSRNEIDPLITARMLVTGRDCLQQVQNKFNEATAAAWKRIDRDTSRQNNGNDKGESPGGSSDTKNSG